MTLFEYITHNIDTVKTLVKAGAIPCAMMNHYSVYSRFRYYTKQGFYRSHAASFTSDDMKVAERSVYRIIERMEGEV